MGGPSNFRVGPADPLPIRTGLYSWSHSPLLHLDGGFARRSTENWSRPWTRASDAFWTPWPGRAGPMTRSWCSPRTTARTVVEGLVLRGVEGGSHRRRHPEPPSCAGLRSWRAGQVSDRPVITMDLTAMLIELVGGTARGLAVGRGESGVVFDGGRGIPRTRPLLRHPTRGRCGGGGSSTSSTGANARCWATGPANPATITCSTTNHGLDGGERASFLRPAPQCPRPS